MKLQNNKIGQTNDKWRKVNGHYVPGRKFSAIKYNAGRRHIKFDLTIEYLDELWLLQNGQCFYSGEVLDITSRNGATASLDRKDSNLGYVPGNVAWVHNDVNYLKHTLDEDRLFELIEKIHERRNEIDTTKNYYSEVNLYLRLPNSN